MVITSFSAAAQERGGRGTAARLRMPVGLVAGIAALSLLGTATAGAAPAPASGRRAITVDAKQTDGTIQRLSGYVGAPCGLDTCVDDPTSTWLASDLREIGVTATRTHDTGAVDILGTADNKANVVFPDPSADPGDPASYNFDVSDDILRGMVRSGFDPLVRLGDGRDGEVPTSFSKYAEIVRHVVRHYTAGWDHGFHWDITNWQVWNEPDPTPDGASGFWDGTAEQFYELYGVIAKAVKSVQPNAKVGGPAAASPSNTTYVDDFIAYVQDHDLPMDFYDYHLYDQAMDPSEFSSETERIRAVLKKNGFKKTPIVISEYGYNLGEQATQEQLGAYESALLAYMQEAGVEQAYNEFFNIGDGNGNSLINGVKLGPDGPGATITPAGRAFQAYNAMQATPTKLATTGGDNQGLTVLAGAATHKSTDTPHEIRVLVSNYEIPSDSSRQATYSDNAGFDLTLKNLPKWARDGVTVRRYKMTSTGMTLAGTSKVSNSSSTLKVGDDLAAPGVELLVLRASDAPGFSYPGVVSQ